MAIDEPSAGGDERRRVVGEPRQRVRCLDGERRRAGSVSPGHVPKPLDRMHRSDLTNGHPWAPGAASANDAASGHGLDVEGLVDLVLAEQAQLEHHGAQVLALAIACLTTLAACS